ncbi:MAG: peptidylprolyl isomerase [Atopobiaceae bacterium]|nr:peptidylprolyl isomerase [Atopobiaceae bacterium]
MTRRGFCAGALGIFGALSLAGCGGSGAGLAGGDAGTKDDGSQKTGGASSQDTAEGPYATGTHHVSIEVEGFGTIECALNANVAPITVANFCKLAGDGFYDGLTFHRIIEGFMIQGGDPKGDGTGGSGQTIKGEFSANGVQNPISHVRGTISMARSQDYNSASSQFFIMQKTNTQLDGQYAAFGSVTSGIEVVDAIAQKTPVQDSNGTVAASDQPRISKLTVID